MKLRILAVGFVALLAVLAFTTPAEAQAGNTYQVFVFSSFGTAFEDCFRFDFPFAGGLTVDGYGLLTWDTNLEMTGRWLSVSRQNPPSSFFSLAFAGVVLPPNSGPVAPFQADGINEFGDTFLVIGHEADCFGVSAPQGESPYLNPDR